MKKSQSSYCLGEFTVMSMHDRRHIPMPAGDRPDDLVRYWRNNIEVDRRFNPEVESLYGVVLNSRNRIKGHYLVSIGGATNACSHPREVFRPAIIASAVAIVVLHNHPSGDPEPSDADIRVAGALADVGSLIRIQLLDSIIVGNPSHVSIRSRNPRLFQWASAPSDFAEKITSLVAHWNEMAKTQDRFVKEGTARPQRLLKGPGWAFKSCASALANEFKNEIRSNPAGA